MARGPPRRLESKPHRNLAAPGICAVRESLGSIADAKQVKTVRQCRLQHSAGCRISRRLDSGIVNGVEHVESFERQIGFHSLAANRD
jgi:hypothetical protein